MNELRGTLLVDGALVPGRLSHAGGRITAVQPDPRAARDPGLPVIAPGLIDLHVHGWAGAEPVLDLAGMARALARVGTTAFLPTLFPAAPTELGRTAERVWASAQALPEDEGARVLGLHLEGPFVNPLAAGALPRSGLAEPSPAGLRAILGPATGDGRGIRTMTLAAELPGAADLVGELARAGVRVSLGHSLASAAEARAAAANGAVGVTHLYNAMGPLHHRRAGLASFALSSDALCAELIGDLVHVGPEAIQIALRARGPGGLALISDALRGAGTGCDVFHSHGHECRVRDGAIWIEDPETGEPRLTGAATPQLDAVRALVQGGVLDLAEALSMASETPARTLGVADEVGRLAPGARADLLVLAGPELRLERVLVGGVALETGARGATGAGR